MPWDGTFLYACDLTEEFGIRNSVLIAGSMDESIFQPQWSPDGVLHFVSDRSGWWNIYRWIDGRVEPVVEMDADFGVPQWVFGLSTYAFLPSGDIVCMFEQRASQKLGVIRGGAGEVEDLRSAVHRSQQHHRERQSCRLHRDLTDRAQRGRSRSIPEPATWK